MIDLDYKVIRLLYESPKKVGVMAKKLKLPHSTIGSSVKRLEIEGYVIYFRYNPVKLSEKGYELGTELMRHSRLLEYLFYHELGLSEKEAHIESDKFNLLLSCNIINKICEKYQHPKECPCGEPILSSFDCFCMNDKRFPIN